MFKCSDPLNLSFRVVETPPQKCPNCTFTTFSRLLLLTHLCPVAGPVAYNCSACTRAFKSKFTYQRHFERQHAVVEKQRWFNCEFCDFRTLYRDSLRPHVVRKHSSDAEKRLSFLKCEHCDYKTSIKNSLAQHVFNKHIPKEDMSWLECEICSYRTKARYYLRRHILKRHTAFETVHCGVCKMAVKKSLLKSHKHKSVERYKCLGCLKDFATKSSLTRHTQRKHTSRDKLWQQCEHCDFRFISKRSITDHVIKMHTSADDRWFKCSECDYKTLHPADLRSHGLRKHTAHEHLPWLQCERCEYKTRINSDLNKHMRSKHKNTETVSVQGHCFKCQVCDATFKLKSTLKTHVLCNHTPGGAGDLASCMFCDFKHVQKGVVAAHMRRKHLDEKLQCPFCHARCKNGYLLKLHMSRKDHIGTAPADFSQNRPSSD